MMTAGTKAAIFAAVFVLTGAGHAFAATCDRHYDVSLDKALAGTIAAVATNHPDALLQQFSHDGVAFGTDGPLVSYVALASQFAGKAGHYCDLFACAAGPGRLHRLFVTGHVEKQIDAGHGLASVVINGNSNDELDLSYRFTAQCRWEITGIGAP